ncbi:MAG: SufBD protein [Oscillibacter sp.]|uniref:SufBD protein n=1 Tax=Oscillibacter sp. TaxID=1945593 RepID=UPI00289BB5B0|nr:SufBD protein [Oscillibacter sp.]MEA4992868.1 SufBD protein [Oscillibacter sp.]
MTHREELTARLTAKPAKSACAYADAVTAESRESNWFYQYLDDFAALLCHKNSLVRNRAISILAANARWDAENRYDTLMDAFLSHVTDEKPITSRQCIQALPEIAAAKPGLIPQIRATLENADLSGYRDSMRPLILKDIMSALQKMAELEK